LMLFHIGLSLFTYAVCFIATLYVIQLVWLDRNLKKRKMFENLSDRLSKTLRNISGKGRLTFG
jgi:ABC-type uncharacterized transport system permease subunit